MASTGQYVWEGVPVDFSRKLPADWNTRPAYPSLRALFADQGIPPMASGTVIDYAPNDPLTNEMQQRAGQQDQWGRYPGDVNYGQAPNTSGPNPDSVSYDPTTGTWSGGIGGMSWQDGQSPFQYQSVDPGGPPNIYDPTQPDIPRSGYAPVPDGSTTPTPSTTPTSGVKYSTPKDAFQAGLNQGLKGQQLTDWIRSQGFSDNGLYYGDSGGQAGQYGFGSFYATPDGKGGYNIIDRPSGGGGSSTGAQGGGGRDLIQMPTSGSGATTGGAGGSPTVAATTAAGLNQDVANSGDWLLNQLKQRATQSLNINPNDPIIQNQRDTYLANQERGRRQYLRELAESQGPNANITAEQRASAEKVGQNTSGFEAQLMQNELEARRQEIQNALTGAQGYLTDQQRMALQQKLAEMDNALQYARLNEQGSEFTRNLNQQESQFGRSLGQRAYEYDTTRSDSLFS